MIVFVDKLAKKDLAEQGVTPQEILRRAGRIYKENGIQFGYFLNRVPIKKWNHNSTIAPSIDSSWDLYSIIFDRAEKVYYSSDYRKFWLKYDVFIFFTGHLFTGYGCSIRSGIIMLGTRNPTSVEIWRYYLFDRLFRKYFWKCLLDCLLESLGFNFRPLIRDFQYFRLNYLKRLSSVLAHEQGHVCGLKHVKNVNSIMYPQSLGSEVFDFASKHKLKFIK